MKCDFVNCRYWKCGECTQAPEVTCLYRKAKENAAPDWVYAPVRFSRDEITPEIIEKVEKALGFKLFYWQKTYILNRWFRAYGETTAKILRDLLHTEEPPLDFRRPPSSREDYCYRQDLIDIKQKLDSAGIPTREVLKPVSMRRKEQK